MLPSNLKSLIEKCCSDTMPTDEQIDEIMDLAISLSADNEEIIMYIDNLQKVKKQAVVQPEKKEITDFKEKSSLPTAEIIEITKDDDVMYERKRCLKINVRFAVQNMKGKQGRVIAYFYTPSGIRLKAYNDEYATTLGLLCVSESFKPRYDDSRYDDFQLYFPYSELKVRQPGDYKFNVKIWGPKTELILSEYVPFTYTLS